MYFTHTGRDIYTKRGESEHSTIFAMVGNMFEAIDEPETAPNAPEAAETDRLTIEYPLEGFTPKSRINLEKLVESKDILIKQALEIDELLIEETEISLRFPWFPADSEGEAVNAYAQFISALCDTAKNKKRVVAKLNAIAQTYEGLSRNKLIEQIVERFVDAESLAAPEEPESTERTEFTPEGE